MNQKALLSATTFLVVTLSPTALMAQNVSPEMAKLIDARDDQRCQKLGALPNTEAYITCRLKLQEMAQANWAAQSMQLQQQRQNEQMVPPPIFFPTFKPYVLPPPPRMQMPKSTNCTSQIIGNQLQTNCSEQ
ncbi:MAG: hypothetical protein Q8L53_04600 [Aestuariivirga sp.]|nr:hypothetical protein [Aestuariivirga sp.]